MKRNIIILLKLKKKIRLKCNELELHNDAFFSSLFFCMSAKIVIFAVHLMESETSRKKYW